MSNDRYYIDPVRNAVQITAVRDLFDAYVAWLGVDLTYQGYPEERAGLPGRYAPPSGELLLARDPAGAALGCVGLRAIDPAGCCEMKRLFVAPDGRDLGVGAALCDAIIAVAKTRGYREIRLDTLSTMTAALGLYERRGFVRIPAYYDTPVADTIFLALSF